MSGGAASSCHDRGTAAPVLQVGTRADFDGTMTSAAQALQPQDLELVADYLSTLQRP